MSETEKCRRLYVKPSPGRSVPMPERNMALLPEAGTEVLHNTYWARRIASGDVTEDKAKSDVSANPKGSKTK